MSDALRDIAIMNDKAYQVIAEQILRPLPAKKGKTHDDLVWDECLRYVLNCIHQNIKVVS